jgi:hypothetical protein
MADDPDPRHMIHFCREFLPGVLTEACGATPRDATAVADDVLSRAEAAAHLDQESREVLSAPFFEESFDHEPDEAPAWMKAVTTLVIRNSRLEDLHVSGPVGAGGITGITTYGLGPLAHLIAARRGHPAPAGAPGSPFAGLADAYPRAWSCLTALRTALASGGGRVGYRLPEAPSPGLPGETEIIAAQPADHLELPSDDFTAVVFSGIDPRFDQSAIKLLKAADEDELLLGLSSLSRISRNSRKLLRTLEFLLSRKTTILTTNYLLTRKEVHVRRRDLVKPVSEQPMDGIRNLDGLSGSHRRTVESYVLQVSQDKA